MIIIKNWLFVVRHIWSKLYPNTVFPPFSLTWSLLPEIFNIYFKVTFSAWKGYIFRGKTDQKKRNNSIKYCAHWQTVRESLSPTNLLQSRAKRTGCQERQLFINFKNVIQATQ